MSKEKKKWENPKLICLYRGRPEEAVLAACKAPTTAGPATADCTTTTPPNKCHTIVST